MCWSGEASVVLSTVGIVATGYAIYKKEPPALWIALCYFTLMEVLQAFTYAVIDQPLNPSNQVATLLGYLHIAFQPFFINMVSLHFLKDQSVARKIAPFAYGLCFVTTVFMLLKVYPFAWMELCPYGTPLCGESLYSLSGTWHIGWSVPLNNDIHGGLMYMVMAFIVPVLYGSWRFTVYHIAAGPLMAYVLTQNPYEWPAVWCLLSIGLLLLVVKTPIRQFLYVDNNRLVNWLSDHKDKANN